ncbi:septum formation initiator family protein [Maribacter sp. ANRC-HE7]|uniref:Septum formation initiator family protein n=1 Tax=Maribacter aquimaris TaxID=2737171 RepID=A0ABR7V1P6_9FLAO|nr:septum formation initiator family protein [Maribacter aquimaris]MBD0778754.1 septum formation initiator family protein [Maribacter aquimaris]
MGLKNLKKKKWFAILTNIYVLVLTVFVIWMLFFDTNSLLIHRELKKEIKNLEKTQHFLRNEIEKDKKIIEKLSDTDELEKFAREHYYLKKKDEEIYLIEYEDSLKLKEAHDQD